MSSTGLLIISLALFLSAFFSGCQMVFFASNKLLFEINRKRHPHLSRLTDFFLAKPGVLVSVILLGNCLSVVVFGIEFSRATWQIIADAIHPSAFVVLPIQILVVTLIIVVVVELLPRTLIRTNSSAMLNVFAFPLTFFFILLYPLGLVMQFVTRPLIERSPGDEPFRLENKNLLPGRVDLDKFLSHQAAASAYEATDEVKQEAKLMKNALDFAKIKVRDCAIPRTDIVAISVDASVEEMHKVFLETGYSKVLVYQDNIDNIIGYVHVSVMFRAAKSIRAMMASILVVPETMSANALLRLFTDNHKSVALVVDEFGGTAGMVTIEDVLEEIFGEIDDEHDTDEHEEQQIDDGEFLFSGRLEIDYLNEKYNLNLPTSEEYDTLAGLVLSVNEAIPTTGDIIEIEGFRLEIAAASRSRIDRVRLKTI